MIIAMISWGVSWPAAKIVGQYSNPEYLIAWRFLFGLISMIFVMGYLKIPISFQAKPLKIYSVCKRSYNLLQLQLS